MPLQKVELALQERGVAHVVNAPVKSRLLTGRAGLVVSPTREQLPDVVRLLRDADAAYTPYGCGSNTLVRGTERAPLQTALITLDRVKSVVVHRGEGLAIAGAGSQISKVSNHTAAVGLEGLEFARDIPGVTAGAIATDAGHPIKNYRAGFEERGIDVDTLQSDIRDVLRGVHVVDGDGIESWMPVDELGMQGRRSRFLEPDNDLMIVSAKFGLAEGDPAAIDNARAVVYDGRRAMRCRNKAANEYSVGRTLGFTFVLNDPRYDGVTASTLIATADSLPPVIEEEGMMHAKATANIVANTGDGTADGYLRVADRIQEAVAKDHGIELPLEVRVVN